MLDCSEHYGILDDIEDHTRRHRGVVNARQMGKDQMSEADVSSSSSRLADALERIAKQLRAGGAVRQMSRTPDQLAAETFMGGESATASDDETAALEFMEGGRR